MVLRKDQLEVSLNEEKKLIESGKLREDNPLDLSEGFQTLCEGCRRGDLKLCQEMISEGVNINARDQFDYTPLILASLCGHYEVVQLLLESGALCERDTFQGERTLYNALNDRIRNLLLEYDYSKSTDPLQPLAAHITSLLGREEPQTADIFVSTSDGAFHLHKFLLSARSPYFQRKLASAPESTQWKLPTTIPPQAFEIAIRYLYLAELPRDLGGGAGTGFTDSEVLAGIDKISRHLEIQSLFDGILENSDRRLARQRRTMELEQGRDQLESWFKQNILKYKIEIETSKVDEVKWDRDNGIFADVLLRADEDIDGESEDGPKESGTPPVRSTEGPLNGIPVGPQVMASRSPSPVGKPRKSMLFPAHRAMLIRSEYFLAMFSSPFREAQKTKYLQIITVDCSPEVLEIVLTFLYTEKADFSLDYAIDVLFAADLLFIEKLKAKAAVVISTLGNGTMPQIFNSGQDPKPEEEEINIYDVIHAGWLTRVQRLEEFGARYIAYHLEDYIDEEEFAELIRESAKRIQKRQETDSIEIIDDIRYYLSERFRLRFEDSGIEEMMDENDNDNVQAQEGDPNLNPASEKPTPEDEAVDMSQTPQQQQQQQPPEEHLLSGVIRTLQGDIVDDEFASDAVNYQHLLGKIDALLDKLKLDA
ncbi:MAG: hypothetical protein M1834_009313 [Cirrosporium novae-zelandiae]|nr:MAG: hypothetical protein M1834_009313 [Cirrosporium novae-zelandiae]